MSNEAHKKDSLLKRYLALKSVRDNILYTKPLTDTLAGSVEDVPGEARSIVAPYGELASSAAVISNDPQARAQQVAKAIEQAKKARGSSTEAGKQMLTNALRIGGISLPVGMLAGAAGEVLGKGRVPFSMKGVRNPFPNAGRNLNPRRIWEAAQDGGLESAGMGAVAGAAGGVFAGAGKPGDEDLAAAGKIIQDHPYASALPGGDVTALLNSYNDQPSSRLANIATGAGVGVASGVAASFGPPTLKAMVQGGKNLISSTPKPLNIPRLYARSLGRSVGRNALLLGGAGAIAGNFLSNNSTQ